MNRTQFISKPLTWFVTALLAVVVAGCGSGSSTPAETVAPTVYITAPLNTATGVALNANITATFNEAMDVATITTTTFSLAQGATPVPGAVTYSGTTAVFNPTSNLAVSTVYTATITTGVKDLAGNALVTTKTWSFTTGTAVDTTAPTVISTVPASGATTVAVGANIVATFSEAMNAATITSPTTFTLAQAGTPVAGVVTFPGTTIATFNPNSNLTAGLVYTATITTAAQDLAGNALAVAKTWSFTAAAVAGPAACTGTTGTTGNNCVALGTAVNYVILAETAITNVPTSNVTGDLGLFPTTGAAIGITCAEVTGVIYSADAAGPACKVTDGTGLNLAVNAKLAAYNDGFARVHTAPANLNVGAGTLNATTVPSGLAPGAYVWNSAVTIPTDLTLVGTNSGTDVWVFKVGGALDVGANIIPSGGALPQNVFWITSGAVTIAAGKHMEGVVLSTGDITLVTGASATGRLLSATQVVLQSAVVTQP